jgi:hypothetical protein
MTRAMDNGRRRHSGRVRDSPVIPAKKEIKGQFGRAPTDPDSLWELIL